MGVGMDRAILDGTQDAWPVEGPWSRRIAATKRAGISTNRPLTETEAPERILGECPARRKRDAVECPARMTALRQQSPDRLAAGRAQSRTNGSHRDREAFDQLNDLPQDGRELLGLDSNQQPFD
jgi:hypothetical protein